jgi:hypothetical protein
MKTQEIADQLIRLCRDGKFEQVYTELYASDVMSVEPEEGEWGTVRGMEGIQKKAAQWGEMVAEMHSSFISEPIVGDDYFACQMKTEITFKGATERSILNEICLYEVRDGKIVKEQFFYTPVSKPVG